MELRRATLHTCKCFELGSFFNPSLCKSGFQRCFRIVQNDASRVILVNNFKALCQKMLWDASKIHLCVFRVTYSKILPINGRNSHFLVKMKHLLTLFTKFTIDLQAIRLCFGSWNFGGEPLGSHSIKYLLGVWNLVIFLLRGSPYFIKKNSGLMLKSRYKTHYSVVQKLSYLESPHNMTEIWNPGPV
jgi:hypothetical protein